jgi:hypothetical protein
MDMRLFRSITEKIKINRIRNKTIRQKSGLMMPTECGDKKIKALYVFKN